MGPTVGRDPCHPGIFDANLFFSLGKVLEQGGRCGQKLGLVVGFEHASLGLAAFERVGRKLKRFLGNRLCTGG